MMKKILGTFLLIFMITFYWSSCTSDTLVDVLPSGPVSFSNDLQPVFDQNCSKSGCHVTGMVSPDLTAGKSYNSLISANLVDTLQPSQSVLYKQVAAGGTMSSYCTKAQSQLILLWIQQGAKNN